MRATRLFSNKFLLLFSIASIAASSITAQTLTKKQQDSAFLIHPGQERLKNIKKSLAKKFVNFVGNDVSLFGSLALSKQNINDNGVTAPINYLYNTVNSNTFNPGYSGGFRIDPISKSKYYYSFSMAFNRIATGTYYQNKYTYPPYISDYTHFKADHVFTTLSIAAHLKKMIFSDNAAKYKFYVVAGPSFDYKISNLSNEQLINGAGNRSIINGDLGAEFNNKGYYTLFAHYKLGTNLFQSSVSVQLNRFEIGMSIRAKDLF
jgi:hypothetical protein